MRSLRVGFSTLFMMIWWTIVIQAETVTITAERLNVRSGPGRTYDVVEVVNTHEKFEILQEQDGWYQISVEGMIGWISRKGTTRSVSTGLQELLLQADRYFTQQQFTTPPEANAYDLYREVLRRDPENTHAMKKINQMAKTYKVWATNAYEKGEYQKAKIFYQRYLFLIPDDQEVMTLLKKIGQADFSTDAPLHIVRLRREPAIQSNQQIG